MAKLVRRSISETGARSHLGLGFTLDISYKGSGDMLCGVTSPTYFGHEQPFAIQMSHERDAEETDSNIKCEFILRENKKQMKLDRKNQKSKKKKMPLSNIFRKSAGKLSTSPRSNSVSEGKLFGHPLDEICDPDLPRPLMELLESLYNVGPYTSEIFRKPPNAKKCLEMVNIMNSSEPEGWADNCNNGLLFASILKTFLKELPGSLCCSRLFTQWAEAINVQDETKRITHIKQIIEKLPKGNQQLLQYIVCIMHHIAERSDENKMHSSNLAICLGPSILTCDSQETSEAETVKITPVVLQFLIDNCKAVFGENILDIFGHPPIQPAESDTEELPERIDTPYNDSLESLSDNDNTVTHSLTQMSPSSCSRDSGLILSDPHEDAGEHSDEHSLRQQLVKSKSYDSLAQSDSRLQTSLIPLQTQVSSDSLGCDDEYVELGSSYNKQFLLTKSKSGAHLCYDKQVDTQTNGRLKERLAVITSRYTEGSPILSVPEGMGYTSSDSDKSDSIANELQKSSTASSLQRGSSSSDDALPSARNVTHRHISQPRHLETTDGHQPTHFLHQFTKSKQAQEEEKKKIRDVMRKKTDPSFVTSVESDCELFRPVTVNTEHKLPASRHPKRNNTESPRISRTNTYAGRRNRAPVEVNLAEMKPIMPQQYRPSRPPSYNEACERNELIKSGVTEIERIKQTVNSAKAKQLYAQSLKLFEQENNAPSPVPSNSSTKNGQHSTQNSINDYNTLPTNSNLDSRPTALSNIHNNNTIGVVKTSNKKIVLKKAPNTKPASPIDSAKAMFYQPGSNPSTTTKSVSSSSLANSFYRPTQPPPYREALQQKTLKPDLIDSLGGESLV